MKTKLLKSLLAIACLLCSIGVYAHDFEVDGIYYQITAKNRVAVIYYGEDYSNVPAKNMYTGSVVIPESVTYEGVTYSVTSIGYQAFYNCTGLTSVSIPEGVTSIGDYAFYNCTGLTSVTIPNSVLTIGNRAFDGCIGLTEVAIGNSVTWIGNYAFYNCTGLTSVSIPEGVTTIAYEAFYNCTGLTSVSIPNSVTSIGESAFYGCSGLTEITIPNSVTSIGSSAFRSCSGLTSVNIPNSVTSIGSCAFEGCSGLTEITIPNSVTSIGDYAFPDGKISNIYVDNIATICNDIWSELPRATSVNLYLNNELVINLIIPDSITSIAKNAFKNCESINSVSIPNSVTSIGDYAFSNCTGLTSVSISEGVTSIGSSAFSNCTELTSVSIPEGVTSIGEYAFDNCTGLTSVSIPEGVTSIGSGAFLSCTSLTEVAIGNSVTSIGDNAFNNCTGLTSVSIPNSVTSIGDQAFYNCTGLTSVSIPEGVTSIGNHAFSDCTGLTEVAIGNSVTSIGESVFQCCYQLQKVTIGSSVAEIGNNTFLQCPILSIECLATVPPKLPGADFGEDVCIFVPSGCGAAYRAAEYWSEYNIIDINPANAVEVTVSKPGYLAVDVDNQGIALKNVTILKVHGKINLTDFSVMRNNMTSCYSIDLSDAECDEIPTDAFSNKRALKSVVLPTQCKVIGDRAFAGCVLLSDSIAFPDGLVSIGYEAFMDCNMAQDVVLPNSVGSIGQSAFSNCKKIKSITLPENLTTIGSYTFADCAQLSNVSFPVTIETIGYRAFSGCKNMTLVDLSGCEKLTTIGSSAFESCSNITTLNLPASLQAVGSSAFANCKKLANISVYATTPPEAGDKIFSNVDNYNCLLSYPTASHVDYLISAHWGAFIETRKSIDVEVEDADCNDCKEGHGCKRHHRGGHIWYDRDWHKHHGKHHAPRRYAAAENEEIVEISGIDATIGDGLSLRVPTDSVVTFLIEPREGYSIGSVHYGEEDVTNQVVNGVFTTDAVNENAVLKVSFVNESGEEEPDYILAGDANDDKLVNISDAVVTMNYILGETEGMKRVDNADMNNDGIINVGDVVGIVNTILGDEGTSAPAYYQGNKGKLQVSDIVVGGDENTPIEIVLDNNMPYTSFQMNVILPAGLKAQGVTLGNRLASTHHVMWKEQADGSLRIAAFAIDNAAIADNTGVLLAIDVVAENKFKNGVVEINNAVFATRNITIHNLDNSSCNVNNTTDVKRIYTIDRVYSAGDAIVVESTCNRVAYITTTSGVTRSVELQAGRNEISMLQQGVYIVVIGDTAHKVVIK